VNELENKREGETFRLSEEATGNRLFLNIISRSSKALHIALREVK